MLPGETNIRLSMWLPIESACLMPLVHYSRIRENHVDRARRRWDPGDDGAPGKLTHRDGIGATPQNHWARARFGSVGRFFPNPWSRE